MKREKIGQLFQFLKNWKTLRIYYGLLDPLIESTNKILESDWLTVGLI